MTTHWSAKPVDNPRWQGVILFDGVCIFCSRWVAFVIARDTQKLFRFTPIQSAFGAEIADRFGIDRLAPETNALIVDGMAYFKSDAAIEVLQRLPRWGWIRILRLLPRVVRNAGYDLIARNRYRIFGQTDACMMPTPEIRARFVFDEMPSE